MVSVRTGRPVPELGDHYLGLRQRNPEGVPVRT